MSLLRRTGMQPLCRSWLSCPLRALPPVSSTRSSSSSPSSSGRRPFSEAAASHASNKTQVYISRSADPLVNLSLEHRLLQVSHPTSTILILYVNRPCVVFGRNQNPWLETNLGALADGGIVSSGSSGSIVGGRRAGQGDGGGGASLDLVRRRSGGGTVFHDEGNVNFGVICPPDQFDRDRHAEMVVRALHRLGRRTTRVNQRHDIVMDLAADDEDSREGAGAGAEMGTAESKTFKISGSAYKLTRLRSLHHGTCLVRSPNLASISRLLRSPAEPFVMARGVDSVRSPVANADVDPEDLKHAVVDEFTAMYGRPDVFVDDVDVGGRGGDSALVGRVDAIVRGRGELASREWVYGQTPKFTFSTHPTDLDPRPRPELPFDTQFHFTCRHGIVEECTVDGVTDQAAIVGASVHDIDDWSDRLARSGLRSAEADGLGRWINGVLGTGFTRSHLKS